MKRKEIRDSLHLHEKINYLINFTDFLLFIQHIFICHFICQNFTILHTSIIGETLLFYQSYIRLNEKSGFTEESKI